MTTKQKMIKAIYPALIKVTGWFNKNTSSFQNETNSKPNTSIYDFEVSLIDGKKFSLEAAKGKKLLIVNTASDCGYTPQYEGLQALHEKYKGQLTIIGFPANDFAEQEKASEENIASFCQKNYGVSFLIAKKSVVIKKDNQNEIFKWLSHKNLNGWNEQAPAWNFCKYLIDKEGTLTRFFQSGIEPLGKEMISAIETK